MTTAAGSSLETVVMERLCLACRIFRLSPTPRSPGFPARTALTRGPTGVAVASLTGGRRSQLPLEVLLPAACR